MGWGEMAPFLYICMSATAKYTYLGFPELYDGIVGLCEGGDLAPVDDELLHDPGSGLDNYGSVQGRVKLTTRIKQVKSQVEVDCN